jgi:hypothetical protein
MYYLAICLFLPIINALLVVKIHPNSLYHPHSFCSSIHNATMSTDASIQSCIWECVNEYDCQTAVYHHDNKICSMFGELCTAGNIEPFGNVQASVICYRKDHGEFIFSYDTEETSIFRSCHYVFNYFNSESNNRARNYNYRCANEHS